MEGTLVDLLKILELKRKYKVGSVILCSCMLMHAGTRRLIERYSHAVLSLRR